MLRISCFADFRVTLNGAPLRAFETEKTKALLAYLAVESDRPHRREYLAGLLWSDQPEARALHNLRQTLSTLRKTLGDDDPQRAPASPPFLLINRESVQLNPASEVWLDVRAFKEQIKKGLQFYRLRDGRGSLNIRALQQALAHYVGAFLDQIYLQGSPLFDEWAMLLREGCSRQAIETLSLLAEYHERRAEYSLARAAAARLVELAPWDETTHTQLIRLHALDGQWSAAQAQYISLQRFLKEQLDLEPAAETAALFETLRQASAQNRPFAPRFAPARHNLPLADTPFVGRQGELDVLATQLADPAYRLITLLGPGGIGKTRLALETAHEQIGLFPDGIYLVGLAAISTPDLLPATIAEALGFKFYTAKEPAVQLIDFLREKTLLFLLDNYEQLLPHTQLIVEILQQAPGIKILITARTPLNLRSENILEVQGLNFPTELALLDGEQASEKFSALQLFEQTARRLLPGFALAAEIPAVARICQLLNGLPLGIELSAAWVRAHDCQAIASQIEQDLDFLTSEMRDTPERHRSLRAVFEHSWKLLPPGLQPVFARLTAFRGGFTPEAARQICEAQPVQLAALVESSLLRKTAPARFELHSLLAQFASEKLHANPHETQTVQARHSRYYAGWLAQQSPKIHGPRQQTSLAQIALEIENARVAWQWAVAQGEAGLIEQSLPALSNFYLMRSRFQEGRDLFASAYISLSKAESGSSPQRLAALLAIQQGGFEIHLGNYEAARSLAESALAALHTNGAGAEIAAALDLQASTAIELGEYQQAKSICTEGLALLQAQNDLPLRAIFYNNLGDVQRVLGNYDEAQAQYQEMLAIYEHLQDDWGLARAYNSLGILAGTRGQYPAAQAYFEKSMTTFRGIGDRSGTARILHNLSILAYLDQDYEKTRQLRHECLEICREIGFQWGITSELKHLADVEKVLGDYSQARAHYEESLRYSQRAGDRKGMAYALDSLGGLDLLQNDLTMARNHYFEALNIAREIEMLPVVVDTLCGIAELLAQAGQPATAIELLSFAARHPASDKQTSAKAEALLATLIEKMPAEAATALRQQGAEATLETLLEKIQGIEIS